jgi:hypothetical protein
VRDGAVCGSSIFPTSRGLWVVMGEVHFRVARRGGG